ncbi:hypothetical protein AB0C06_12380 [Micromonospora inaquosa]|uniref:hypothetical protein n=1 Tax=Micromonospora inaquosa TaxID=2203716 RepID=UPI003401C749
MNGRRVLVGGVLLAVGVRPVPGQRRRHADTSTPATYYGSDSGGWDWGGGDSGGGGGGGGGDSGGGGGGS